VAAVPSIGRAATVASATDATERLYARHHRKVYAFCLYQLRDRDDAAEATQTTFLQALTALRRGVDPTFELTWLIAIARNVCRSRWDAGKRRSRIELVQDPHDLAKIAPAREVTELVGIEDALAALPDPQRRALLLREWQGLSYQEIADELGVSLSAAETLIFRGRRALARELGADEKGKRSFGIGSLLGTFKSTVGGGLTAKVAVGVVAVGIGVAATHELARPAATPRRAPSPADRSHAVRPTSPSTPSTAPRTPIASAPTAAGPARAKHTVAAAGRRAAHPRSGTVAGTASAVPAGSTPAAGATPTATAAPPDAQRAAPTSGSGAAPESPAAAAPGSSAAKPTRPTASTAAPGVPAPVTDAVQPVAGAVGDAAGAVAGAVDPVVTAVTNAAAPVVTTVTTAAAPVVNTVTTAAAPVVTTVTTAAAPVVNTVTNAVPTPPAPAVPPVHLP
jgi:RNA polymerase sigma factor (sigma-70 family)